MKVHNINHMYVVISFNTLDMEGWHVFTMRDLDKYKRYLWITIHLGKAKIYIATCYIPYKK